MNRLDQLAQPIRRNGEHIRAIVERERREQMEMMDETESLGGGRRSGRKTTSGSSGSNSKMSRSMIHLAGEGAPRPKYNLGGGISTSFLPLGSGSRNACKSMIHLSGHYCCNDNNNAAAAAWSYTTPRSNLGLQTAATKKYLQSSLASSASTNTSKRGQISNTNLYRFDTDSLLLMNSPSLLLNPGVCACLQSTTTTTTAFFSSYTPTTTTTTATKTIHLNNIAIKKNYTKNLLSPLLYLTLSSEINLFFFFFPLSFDFIFLNPKNAFFCLTSKLQINKNSLPLPLTCNEKFLINANENLKRNKTLKQKQ